MWPLFRLQKSKQSDGMYLPAWQLLASKFALPSGADMLVVIKKLPDHAYLWSHGHVVARFTRLLVHVMQKSAPNRSPRLFKFCMQCLIGDIGRFGLRNLDDETRCQ